MKQLVIFLLLLPFGSTAQHRLSGSVKDAEGRAVPFADMALLKAQDSSAYRTALADELGRFEIGAVEKGNYIVKAGSVGMSTTYKNIEVTGDMELGDIVLARAAEMLEGVEIVSKRPVVKRLVDRMEFTVENSSLASNNAWEIVSKTPGVTTSGGGGITIRGSQSILVTINDKKVYMSGDELKQYLENTSGEDVKSVEVITNPPAKYDAQGSAVLNIKLKKAISPGYKGSINTAYVQSMYPKAITSTGHIYKGKKLSLMGRYSFGMGEYVDESTDIVRYYDENGNTASEWKSLLRRKSKSLEQHSYRLEASYELDSLNLFSIGTTGFQAPEQHGKYAAPTSITGADGQLDSLYVTMNNRKNPARNAAYNFLYERKLSEKSKLVFNSDFTNYLSKDNQDINTTFSLPDSAPYRDVRFVSKSRQGIKLFSAQADYSNETNGALEAGIKYGNVSANSNLDYRDAIDGVLVPNEGRTSKFLYDEWIYAGYVSYGREFGKWSVKAGLRGEYTSLEGNSVTTSEVNDQNYFKLFPTFYTMYKPSENHEIGFSYGKRISRPRYSMLNPFRVYNNNYSYFTGDPKLLPTITHNLNLLYTLKGKYNFDLFYRLEKDPSMEISYQDYETNTVVYHFTNIDKDYAFGLEFNTNLAFSGWWDAGIQSGLSYVEDRFQGIDGKLYKNGKPTYNASINNRFALNKKKDFNGEINFYYNSSSVQGTFVFTSTTNLSLALRKKILKGNGEVYGIFSDIYRGEKINITTNYGNQYNSSDSYGDTQNFRLGFRYSFGNQKLKERNKEQTEEQRRI
ncbi:hypothetical protein D3C87_59720 [compost metagenome]